MTFVVSAFSRTLPRVRLEPDTTYRYHTMTDRAAISGCTSDESPSTRTTR